MSDPVVKRAHDRSKHTGLPSIFMGPRRQLKTGGEHRLCYVINAGSNPSLTKEQINVLNKFCSRFQPR